MKDIIFNCPHCLQSLEAPGEIHGQEVQCPICKRTIQIPASVPSTAALPEKRVCPSCGHTVNAGVNICSCLYDFRTKQNILGRSAQPSITNKKANSPDQQTFSPAVPLSASTKSCPYCSETILRAANKCKYCGEFLDSTAGKKSNDKRWSDNEMTTLVILSLLVPLSGVIFGILGLSKEARKTQGAVLFCISVIIFVIIATVRQIDVNDHVSKVNTEYHAAEEQYNREMKEIEKEFTRQMDSIERESKRLINSLEY